MQQQRMQPGQMGGTPSKFATPPPPGAPSSNQVAQKGMTPQQPNTPQSQQLQRQSKLAPTSKPQGLDPIALLNERENR